VHVITIYISCSDINNVIVITRRHDGGILNVNTDGAKCGNLTYSCRNVICRPYISTAVQFHTQQYANICKFTRLQCCKSIPI